MGATGVTGIGLTGATGFTGAVLLCLCFWQVGCILAMTASSRVPAAEPSCSCAWACAPVYTAGELVQW